MSRSRRPRVCPHCWHCLVAFRAPSVPPADCWSCRKMGMPVIFKRTRWGFPASTLAGGASPGHGLCVPAWSCLPELMAGPGRAEAAQASVLPPTWGKAVLPPERHLMPITSPLLQVLAAHPRFLSPGREGFLGLPASDDGGPRGLSTGRCTGLAGAPRGRASFYSHLLTPFHFLSKKNHSLFLE